MGTIIISNGIPMIKLSQLQEAVSAIKCSWLRSFAFLFRKPDLVLLYLWVGCQWCAAAGKDFEGDKEIYGSAEWKERVEKWKVRQEKRGLVSNTDGGNDQAEEDDYL